MELEKRFWSLVGNSTSGRIDIGIITPLVSPPLPNKLVTGLFKAFDENQDGHVDFKELAVEYLLHAEGLIWKGRNFA